MWTAARYKRESGFALLPVVLGIALLGAITYMISRESAGNINIVRQAQDQASERALLDAALAHGKWLAMNNDCEIPGNLPAQSLNGQQYDLSFAGTTQALDIVGTVSRDDGSVISDSANAIPMYDYANPRQLELVASDDAFMRLQLLNNNGQHGGENEIKVKRKFNDNKRGLLKFDLTQVPPGSLVDSASLQLYMNSADSSENDIAFHVLQTDWNDSDVSGTNPWSSTGGDFNSSSELIMPGTSNTGNYSIEISSLVERWLNNELDNYGVLLKMVNENSGNNEYKFRSREYSDPTQRPKLFVNYVCPCDVPCEAGIVLEDLLIGTENTVDIAGQTLRPEDLLRYSPGGPSAEPFFDGSAAGLGEDIRAVHQLENNRLLLAIKNPVTLNGVNFQPQDVLEYAPEDGLFRMYLDGSAFDIDENISSLALRADGVPVISLEQPDQVFGTQYQNTDLFAVDMQARSSELVMNGSAHGINKEIDASHITADGQLLLSFKHPVTLSGVDFKKGDVVQLNPASSQAIAYFDGTQFSDTTRLTALHAGKGFGSINHADLHFPFESDSVGTTPDVIGSRDGILLGSPEWVPGGINGAYRFDGIDDEIQVANDADLQLDGDFTLSMWIYQEGDRAGEQYLVTKQNPPEPDKFLMGLRDGALFWALEKDTESVEFGPYTELDAASWHHIVITLDTLADKAVFYLNGEQLASVDTGYDPVSNGFDLHFGQGFEGVMDEIRLHNRAVSAIDVKRLFEQSPPAAPDQAPMAASMVAPESAIGACDGSYADFFNAGSYSNSDGTLYWPDPWNEYRDDGSPSSGKVEIANKRLKLSDEDRALYRKLPIGNASSADLAFNVVAMSFSVGDSNHLGVYISSSGAGGPWTELAQLKKSDISPIAKQINLDSYIGGDTWISFDTSSDSSAFDSYEIDNVQIRCQP